MVTRPLLRALWKSLEALGPDLVVVVKGRFIPPAWVEHVRRALHVPIINYYPDTLSPGYFDPRIVTSFSAYDEVVTCGDYVADALVGHGIERVRVIPFGYDPMFYDQAPHATELCWDVSLIGAFYPERLPFALAVSDLNSLVSC